MIHKIKYNTETHYNSYLKNNNKHNMCVLSNNNVTTLGNTALGNGEYKCANLLV